MLTFNQNMINDFQEWKTIGYCKRAANLNRKIGLEYFDTSNPHFFVGNPDAEVVMVHLNPKRDEPHWNKPCNFADFNAYWNYYRYFGERMYGESSPKLHTSKFDHKQIRFLRPFNILDIDNKNKYKNLKNVIDDKYQIELIPYGSPNFDYNKIGIDNLLPFIENTIDEIGSKKRKYIIFCGRVFSILLRSFIKKKQKQKFKLKKVDGSETLHFYDLTNIEIATKKSKYTAVIAPQFAKQGCPITNYGIEIAKRYNAN